MKFLRFFLAFQIALLPVLIGIAPALAGQPESEKKLFLVTAYYSPLPDQRFYVRGSFEADVRLNGRGTNGADGTQVFVGMIAAPRSYAFGTRIRIPGLGVGEVHDRGGRILVHDEYDRVDIWMGRGEEGLVRALRWGARLVEGEVYWNPSLAEMELDYSWINTDIPPGFISRLTERRLKDPVALQKPVNATSSAEDIRNLQETLTAFGHYAGPISGSYDAATREAVLAFQLAEKVVKNASAPGAGVYGPATRQAMKLKVETYNADLTRELSRLQENQLLLAAGLGKNARGEEVEALQRMLWELGYYQGPLTGRYDRQTLDAVFEFQKAQGILQNPADAGAGYFGKKTHAALLSALDEKIDRVKDYPRELQAWVPAEKPLPKIATLTLDPVSLELSSLHFATEALP